MRRQKSEASSHKRSKYKKASKMGCKGPFDARFETAQSARRALSDYVVKNVQKRNFSKMGCSIFLPPKKLKRLQKWDARVHLTRDLKQLNQHDELYQITLSKTSKNVIFQKWYSSFLYPNISEKSRNCPQKNKKVTKLHFD